MGGRRGLSGHFAFLVHLSNLRCAMLLKVRDLAPRHQPYPRPMHGNTEGCRDFGGLMDG